VLVADLLKIRESGHRLRALPGRIES
jgi:hypothetical protein